MVYTNHTELKMTEITDSHIFSRDYYISILCNNICVVTFTKRDGSERIMRCTLKNELLPVSNAKTDSEVISRKINPDMISVWDLEKNAWRGFTIKQIKQIKQES